VVFSADDRVLIKLLRQKKEYGAEKFFVKFPSKPNKQTVALFWTLHVLG